ncbi:hypothetical protein CpecS_0531 [Chlamydia pecorum VR629]|nr:hypothetical protein CpecS_0531 [Chlamydia pecorum VR629]
MFGEILTGSFFVWQDIFINNFFKYQRFLTWHQE